MSKEVRYYQKECQEAIINGIHKGITNQLAVLATGTGKSYISVCTLSEINKTLNPHNKPNLWCTHTEELIDQSATALLAEMDIMPFEELLFTIDSHNGIIEMLRNSKRGGFFNDPRTIAITNQIGVIKADLFDIDKPIVIASMATLWRRLDKISPDYFNVIVVDEAHYSGAKTWVTSLNYFRPILRLGLTATPYRTDGMLMGDIFDEIIYEYDIARAIKDGFLCEIDAIQIRSSANLDELHTVAGDFNQSELVQKVNTLERNNLIVNKYLQYAAGRQFIAFCVDVQHTQDLCQAFNEKGIKTEFVVGDQLLTTDRKGIIRAFKNGEIVGITNCMVLTAGFDHADTGVVIMACPTKSKSKFLQQLGRGTRLKSLNFVAKFGQNCIILDVVDGTTKHKLINTFTLDKGIPTEEKVFITNAKRQMLIDARIEREHTFTSKHKANDVKVDLFQLPKVKLSKSLAMQEPATEKQLALIAKFGHDIVNNHYTKKMCNEIISNQPASESQIWRLKKEGYDVSNGVTIAECAMAFEEIKARAEKAKLKEQTVGVTLPFSDL